MGSIIFVLFLLKNLCLIDFATKIQKNIEKRVLFRKKMLQKDKKCTFCSILMLFYIKLMCFKPVFAPTGISHQWHAELVGILHFFYHNLLHLFFLFRIDGEVEFIVYLNDHLAPDAFFPEAVEDAYHRHLDDVCL